MRIAPSRRIVSPLSIGFSMMWAAVSANSDGLPRRDGCGTAFARESRASGATRARIGVSTVLGATVQTRILQLANTYVFDNLSIRDRSWGERWQQTVDVIPPYTGRVPPHRQTAPSL